MESDNSPDVGWYSSVDGTRKYWDGTTWLTPDPPLSSTEPNDPPPQGTRKRRRFLPWLVVLLLAVVLGGASLVVIEYTERSRAIAEAEAAEAAEAEALVAAEAEEQARLEREAEAAAEAEAQEESRAAARAEAQAELDRLDEAFLSSNPGEWVIEEPGNIYWRYSDDSDELTCGRWDCLGVVMFTYQGCPAGLYVEAAIEADGVVIGRTNDAIGAIPPEGTGAIFLEDLTGYGDTFRVTQFNCR